MRMPELFSCQTLVHAKPKYRRFIKSSTFNSSFNQLKYGNIQMRNVNMLQHRDIVSIVSDKVDS